jgi:hypothetical protein
VYFLGIESLSTKATEESGQETTLGYVVRDKISFPIVNLN